MVRATQPHADGDPTGENQRHGDKRALALLECGGYRSARMAEDVPQQEDQNSGRERVEEALNHLGNATHARDGKAQKNRRTRNCAQPNGRCLAHSELVRAKATIR